MAHERLLSRAIVRITPEDPAEDAAGFLQGLVTNDVTGELPVYAGLLTPQGKALFDFIVWPASRGALLIDCEASAADDLVRRLSLYRLRRKIGIANRTIRIGTKKPWPLRQTLSVYQSNRPAAVGANTTATASASGTQSAGMRPSKTAGGRRALRASAARTPPQRPGSPRRSRAACGPPR